MNTLNTSYGFIRKTPEAIEKCDWDSVTYAGAIVLNEHNQMLCIDQDRGIDIPGGHRESGESPLETLLRETYEETGVAIHSPVVTLIVEGETPYKGIEHPKMIFYVARVTSTHEAFDAFKNRPEAYAHEAHNILFLSPEEFIARYKNERTNPETQGFVENMQFAVEKAYEQIEKGGIKVGLSGLGDHQVRGHLIPLNAEERVSEILAYDTKGDQVVSEMVARYSGEYRQVDKKIQGVTQTYDALLEARVRAVFICSPDRFHIEQTKAAVDAGVHIFCEKPLLDTVGESEILIQNIRKATQKGLVITSCHPRRFDRPFVWLKKYLTDATSLGKIQDFHFEFEYPEPKIGGGESLHTGLLADHFNHEIDLLHFFFGFSHFTAKTIHNSERGYKASGVRDDGMQFTFEGSRNAPRGTSYRERVRIKGSNGTLLLDADTGEAIFTDSHGVDTLLQTGLTTDYVGRFEQTTRNFVDAVLAMGRNYLTPNDLIINNISGVQLTENGVFDSRSLKGVFSIID